MKAYKTMLSVVLAIMMLVTMIVPTWAAMEGTLTGGSITINDAVKDQTYSIYQILYLESYNATTGAYAYKANSEWSEFVNSDKIKDVYLEVDAQGYVTWHQNKKLTCTNEEGESHTHNDDECYTMVNADAAAFAKLAEAYAKTQVASTEDPEKTVDKISPVKDPVTATTTTVKFEELKLGYYLVTTTLGTLCSLNTTNPNATIKEKNKVPTNTKEVKEDSTGAWGSSNDADINQVVEYRNTITLPVGSENVTFYDKMSSGLTLDTTSIKVYTNADLTTEFATSNYTLTTTATDDYTFKIEFAKTYLDSLTTDATLYVAYTAKVNENAVVGLPGNDNESHLDYGDTTNIKSTPTSKTTTYTWDMDVLKYANGKESDVLSGAQFVLIKKKSVDDSENPGKKKLVDDKVAKFTSGKLAEWTDISTITNSETGAITWPTESVLTTNESGKIEIDGLDADTYYLREIKAPDGYNMLDTDVEVVIEGAKTESGKLTYETVVAKVNNQSGTKLPETGGIGTTIFYCAGAILALGAFVLLVTKKRMGRE